MVFNIGNQQAGVINNVAGEQIVTGPQQGSVTIDIGAGRPLLERLRREVEKAALPEQTRASVETELDACDTELAKPEPDRRSLQACLANVAQVLTSVGAIASAGTGLGAALSAVAAWLGLPR